MDSPKNIASVNKPLLYDSLINYAETPRNSYKEMRNAVPDRKAIRQALNDYLENCKFENCIMNEGYIKALGFEMPKK
jgi:hypothetical protein